MKEFDLIRQHFAKQGIARKDVVLGIGDDCAILQAGEFKQIAVTTDTLVAGVHFPESTSARAIGHKVVAVSLSDLAAMGAEPCWISLAITMPEVDADWVSDFCSGIFELCEYYNVQLVGGDTTQGPLSVTVTAQGMTPEGKFLTRHGAKPGDWLYITGDIGDAACALKAVFGQLTIDENFRSSMQTKLDFPTPRVLAGQLLREYASSCIDVSDGLLSDLDHICKASSVGANVVLDQLPISTQMRDTLGEKEAIELAMTGGDDYELLFTVSEDNKVGMETAMSQSGVAVTCIGQINNAETISTTLNSEPVAIVGQGFQHFSTGN